MSDDLTTSTTQQEYPQLFRVFDIPSDQALNVQNLHQWLSQQVLHLLKNDFEKLMQVLYRIDVPETTFREAMKSPDLHRCADQIAHAMIDREREKAIWRKRNM